MKLQIRSFKSGGANATGSIVGLNLMVRTPPAANSPAGAETLLELQTSTEGLSLLIARLLELGVGVSMNTTRPALPDGHEQALTVRATHAAATLGPDGEALLMLRFGAATVDARLSKSEALALSRQLANLSAPDQSPTAH